MIAMLAPVGMLLTGIALLIYGHGLQTTVVPLRAQLEGFTELEIGAIGSAYFLGFIFGCLLAPHAIRRVGHIRAFTALVSTASAVALLHVLVIDPLAWMLMRVATGFTLAGFYIIAESWLNDRATNATRGLIMSAYVTVVSVGVVIGQSTAALGSIDGFVFFALSSVVVSLAVLPVAMTKSAQPAPITVVRLRPKALYAASPAAFVSIIFIGFANGSLWSLTAIYATSVGLTSSTAALFAATYILGGAIVQWPIGRLSDQFDRRLVLIGLSAAAALSCIALVGWGLTSVVAVFALVLLVGATTQPAYAIANAHAYDHVGPEDYVETASSLLLMYGFGSVVGPTVSSAVMGIYGPNALFILVAAIEAAMLAYLILRVRQRSAAKDETRESFDYAATAPVVATTSYEAMELSDDVVEPELPLTFLARSPEMDEAAHSPETIGRAGATP